MTKPLALVFQFLQAGMGRSRPTPTKPRSVSAFINRWTGKPHEHNRAKARHLSQLACRRVKAWGSAWEQATTKKRARAAA